MKTWISRVQNIPREFALFLIAVSFGAFSQGIMDSSLNNFLNETFSITDLQRSLTEIPREIPGFLVVFVSAMFFFMGSRRLGFLANVFCAVGALCIGLFSFSFPLMLIWLFIYSLGQHIFLPLNSSIGMDLAKDGRMGRRLGQLSGAANFASIGGFFLVLVLFKFLKLNFRTVFMISAVSLIIASVFMFKMKPDQPVPGHLRLKLRKEYGLFYWLSILYGTRKQIFLTFAPWVLVSVFKQKTEVIAGLLAAGGIIGIFVKPLIGRTIDHFGEKAVLMSEAFLLIFVCGGYGLSGKVFPGEIAFIVVCVCYVMDQILMAAGMARATYLKKIALADNEVASTLAMGTTIDHVFSISIAVTGGILWKAFGYQAVFMLGAGIAMVNLFSAARISYKKV